MGLNKFILWVIFLCCLSGCAHGSSNEKSIYEQGYRAGVKEQMREIAAQFQGGNFPYYHWAAPIVQDVQIPAHIENGVFIPAHNELVLIKPGEWMKDSAYPIKSQETITHEENIQDRSVADITVVPKR